MAEIRSIDAVLNHAPTDYLYMCAKEDFSGNHNFTSSYRQHVNNAKKYQAALAREIKIGEARRRAEQKK
jgi:UPF0755 protein